MMANSVACVLLTPSFFESLSKVGVFSVMNSLLNLEPTEALTIFSMSSNEVDFVFMMLLFC